MQQQDTTRPSARPFRQFCQDIGISVTTGYQEVKAGRLIVAKIGTKTIVTDDRAREYLKSREVATVPPSRNPRGKRGKRGEFA